MLKSPEDSSFDDCNTAASNSAAPDQLSDVLPKICDVLFTQASFDLGNLTYLEGLMNRYINVPQALLRIILF